MGKISSLGDQPSWSGANLELMGLLNSRTIMNTMKVGHENLGESDPAIILSLATARCQWHGTAVEVLQQFLPLGTTKTKKG